MSSDATQVQKPQKTTVVTFSPKCKSIHAILELDEKTLLSMPKVVVSGHVKYAKLLFLHIKDGSTTSDTLQLVFKSKEQRAAILNTYKTQFYSSTSITAVVKPVLSKGKGQKYDFIVETLQIVGRVSDPDTFLPALPNASVQTWSSHHDIRGHSAVFHAIFTIRAALSTATHEFMAKMRVKHLDPNVVTSSDCEGAGEMFIVTTFGETGKVDSIPTICAAGTSDKADTANRAAGESSAATSKTTSNLIDWSKDFFSRSEPARLTVSSQLELEMEAASMHAVYTTNPSFRAEPSKTTRHVASFTHVEAELPHIEFSDFMDFEEEYVRFCIQAARQRCPKEIKLLEDSKHAPGLGDKLESFIKEPFARLSYSKALEILEVNKDQVLKDVPEIAKAHAVFLETNKEKISKDPEPKAAQAVEFRTPKFGEDLGGRFEDWLARWYFKRPVFIFDMPESLKSFYMLENEGDGSSSGGSGGSAGSASGSKKTVQGADLLIPGLGELIGSSMREYRYEKLVSKMIRRGMFTLVKKFVDVSTPDDSSKADAKAPKETDRSKVQKLFEESKAEDLQAFIKDHGIDFGPLKSYVGLRKNASIRTGGFGLGFDRLVVICTSSIEGGNIRHCIPFPVAYQELS